MNEKEKEKNSHIDYSRSHENKYLVQKDLKEIYRDEFSQALKNYNEKQKELIEKLMIIISTFNQVKKQRFNKK